MFGKVFYCGDKPGMAQSMKLANNFLSATGMAASSEAIAMGVKAGLDPSLMCDVINAGSGMNTATTQKFPRSVLPGTFDYGFGMALMVKDVRLFLAEAEDYGIPLEVAKAVGSLWETAMKEHGEQSDFTELAKTVEKRAGVQMRAKKKHRGGAMSDDIWEVYAVRYAEHQRKAAENYIGGDPHDVLQPLDYFVWVIKNGKRTFAGRHRLRPAGRRRRRGRTVITPIDQGLKRLGVEPDTIEDVIISHMHYDHCGNIDMFPRARYHVQDKEMNYCTGRCMCHKQLRNSYEEGYVVSMLRKVFAGRVTLPRRRERTGAGHHAASHRRPRHGLAERPGEDEARLRDARLRRGASVPASRRGAGVSRPPTISPRCSKATRR